MGLTAQGRQLSPACVQSAFLPQTLQSAFVAPYKYLHTQLSPALHCSSPPPPGPRPQRYESRKGVHLFPTPGQQSPGVPSQTSPVLQLVSFPGRLQTPVGSAGYLRTQLVAVQPAL